MDLLSIFDGSKPLKKISVTIPSLRNERSHPPSMAALDDILPANQSFLAESGTDYIDDYVREEEERMLSEAAVLRPPQGDNNFEGVSLGTAVPNHHDPNKEELTEIYNTYSFDRRPKENLTITTLEDKIVSTVAIYPVTVIEGPTGCGKTTQVPQFILDAAYKNREHCNIIVTQPRRIAAISIAKRVSQERGWPVGTLVGYKIGMVNNTCKDTRLTYCTTGVLLHKLIADKNMNDYTHVIIDEVHERDQEMDFLLLVVRKLQRSNSRFVRVILMSATFNVDKFANYFSRAAGNEIVAAPVIDVEKTNFFKLQINYLCQLQILSQAPDISMDDPRVTRPMMVYCQRILHVFDDIDKESKHRYAVLIFLPGIWEIEEMHGLLTAEDNAKDKWDVVVLHSSITNEEQQRVFELPPTGHRRIILATNIAESSITVPDIKYVIDFCLTKQLVTDPKTNYQCLELGWASKANCEQRAGRAGRLMDGRVYRLVPKRFYDTVLAEDGIPEIVRAPLENVVLNAKMLDMGEPKALLALSLDPPDLSNLERTILVLKETGALLNKIDDTPSPYDGDLTDLGRIMAQLPVDIRISKLIALGHVFSVLRETIIMGASMAVKNMFSTPFGDKLQAYAAKLAWSSFSSSDCVAFLNVYNMWMLEKANQRLKNDFTEKRWAKRNFLQIRVLREIDALVQDITVRLRNVGIMETMGPGRVNWSEDEKLVVVKIIIAGAFYPHYYTKRVDEDDTAGVKILGGLDPTKTIYLRGWPVNQPGPLYARRIQHCLRDCVDSNVAKILVSFDQSSRIYVQFRKNESPDEGGNLNNNDEPGEISLSVYKAVKLRNTNDVTIEIPVMTPERADDMAKELNIRRNPVQMLISREEAVAREKERSGMGIRPVLPGLDISCIPIIVRRIVTPGHFWAQIKDKENMARLRNIQSMINSDNSENLSKIFDTPEIGSLVVAPREQNNHMIYHRAIVQKLSMETKSELLAKVLFIDYGYVDRVRVRDLRRLQDNDILSKIPALAFECVLAEIRPSVMSDITGRWSQEATVEFHNLLAGDFLLYGQVYSVVNGVVYLKLVRSNGKEEIDLNEHLVKLGYAERKEENYLSRYNHELRKNHSTMPLRQRQHHEELQHDQTSASDRYPEAPDLKDCPLRVTLQGPYSPLEIGLTSMTNAGIGMRINIERSSVNNVLLDTNVDDPHHRLVIAGSVTQSTSGRNLNLRNTTVMPNIAGLTSLVCLMFAPKIELRRNSTGTRYSGALCGLGCHPVTRNSIFHEHDISVYFDVDITMDDLQDINRLRHWMSLGIHALPWGETNNDDAEQIAFCQNRVKDVLLALLEKQRSSITQELVPNFDKWCRYDERLFIPPGKVATAKRNIFTLHSALELNKKDDERDVMIAHIQELRDWATRHYRDNSIADVSCKLCNSRIFGVWELRNHINTAVHKFNEKKFHPLPT